MTAEKFTELFDSCLAGAFIVVTIAWCFVLISKSIPEKTSASNERLKKMQESNARLHESNARLEESGRRLQESAARLRESVSLLEQSVDWRKTAALEKSRLAESDQPPAS